MIGERISCLNIVAHTLERHTHLAIEIENLKSIPIVIKI